MPQRTCGKDRRFAASSRAASACVRLAARVDGAASGVERRDPGSAWSGGGNGILAMDQRAERRGRTRSSRKRTTDVPADGGSALQNGGCRNQFHAFAVCGFEERTREAQRGATL